MMNSYSIHSKFCHSKFWFQRHIGTLEYDSDRAGGFEPLRFVPKVKIVVLGLVSK
jgi:hypothetical protein